MSEPIRIVLADDQELVLEWLRSLLESEEDMRVLATAKDGARLVEMVRLLEASASFNFFGSLS